MYTVDWGARVTGHSGVLHGDANRTSRREITAKYLSFLLQSISARDENLSKTMFLPLAERMVEKMVKEDKIEAEAEVSIRPSSIFPIATTMSTL